MNLLPENFAEYQNKPGYFITYFGDIYLGYVHNIYGYEQGFFIIPRINTHELIHINQSEHTPELLSTLGWEITDPNIIKDIFPYNENEQPFNYNHIPIYLNNDYKIEKMFVFGAGASAFCCYDNDKINYGNDDFSSPLGYDIFSRKFDSLIRNYPAVKYSTSEFKIEGNTIEEYLENEWIKYRRKYKPLISLRHINIQYYIRDLFNKISKNVTDLYFRDNLYSTFSIKLQTFLSDNKNHKSAIVSFNYDSILEYFVGSASGNNLLKIKDYVDWDKNDIIIFKPHGSCNWGWKFKPDNIRNIAGIPLHQYLFEHKIEPYKIFYNWLGDLNTMVDSSSYGHEQNLTQKKYSRYSPNKNLIELISPTDLDKSYPALLLPYKEKDEFIMPYEHQLKLQNCLRSVKEIYLIGWKGNEELFNKQLKMYANQLKRIVIINPESNVVRENIRPYISDLNFQLIEIHDFEDFVLDKMDDLLKNDE